MEVRQGYISATICFVMILLMCIVAEANANADAVKVKALFAFGDSLLDVGNNNYLPHLQNRANSYPYGIDFPTKKATGRYSNGKNAADFIEAEQLGLGSLSPPAYLSMNGVPSLNNFSGVNFASAGAGISDTANGCPKHCIPLNYQVNYFMNIRRNLTHKLGKKCTAKLLKKKSLFVFSVGINDISSYYYSKSPNKQSFPEFLNLVISALKTQLQKLFDAGARKILYFNVAPIGCIPANRLYRESGECEETANKIAVTFNKELHSVLKNMSTRHPDFKYAVAHTYDIFSGYIEHYKSFGFKDAIDACCGGGRLNAELPCMPNSTVCSNRAEYLFWDAHPTQKWIGMIVHQLFHGPTSVIKPLNLAQAKSESKGQHMAGCLV